MVALMTEQRHFHRVNFSCLVAFETTESQLICEVYDLSLSGALIGACSGATPAVGTRCKLTVALDMPEDQFDVAGDVQIVMSGTIAHKIENRIGIQCNEIDVDSMTNLRRLIEVNLGDANLMHRELDALIRP